MFPSFTAHLHVIMRIKNSNLIFLENCTDQSIISEKYNNITDFLKI